MKGTMQVIAALVLVSVAVVSAAKTNITAILEKYPDYSQLNQLLTQTHVADEINSKNSITLLALSNQQIGNLYSQLGAAATTAQWTDILKANVLLQYVDVRTITNNIKGNMQVATLYQTTGKALGQSGVANFTLTKTGDLALKGYGSNTTITSTIEQIPYNITLLGVSNPFLPTGVLATAPSSAPAPAPASTPSPAPAPAPAAPSSSPSVSPTSGPSSDSPPSPSSLSKSHASALSFASASLFGLASLASIFLSC